MINLETLKAVLELDVSKFSSAAKQAQKEAQGFGKGMNEHLSSTVRNATMLGNIAAQGATALGRAALSAGRTMLTAASGAEQANVAFTQFFQGNTERAMAFQKQLEDFAARTPFEFPQLRQAASSMMAVGIASERVIPILTTVGDAISSIGGGEEQIQRATRALTQMSQKGKVSAEEMLQLTEAGIPAWDALAGVLGVDVAEAMKMVERRTVDAATMFEALEKKSGKALASMSGMMEVQAKTFQGMISTFKDTVTMAAGRMFTPLMQVVTRELPAITKQVEAGLSSIGPVISRAGEQAVTALVKMLPAITPVVEGLVKLASALLSAVLPSLERLAPLAGKAATILGGGLSRALDVVGPALTAMTEKLGPDLPKIAEALSKLAVASADLFVAVSPLLATLIELKVQILVSMAGYLTSIAEALTPLAKGAADSDVAMRGLVGAYLAFKAVGITKTAVEGMVALQKAIEAVTKATVFKTLADSFDTIALKAMYAADAIKAMAVAEKLRSLWGAVAAAIPAIIAYGAAWWSAAAAVIAATWPILLAVAAIVAIAAAAIWAYKNVGWFHDAVDAVGRKIAEVWNDYLVPFGGWLTGTLIPAIVGVASAIWEFVSNWEEIPGKVGRALSALPGLAAQAFGALLGWLVGFGSQIASTVLGWVGSFLAWIPGALAQLPGQLAYLAGYILGFLLGMVVKIPLTMAAGAVALAKWVWDAIPGLLSALAGLASNLWAWITSVAATIGAQLVQWGLQFAVWAANVATQIGPWLASVAEAVWGWITSTAASIGAQLVQWAVQFALWVASVASQIGPWLASVWSSFVRWIGEVRGDLPGHLAGWARAFQEWVGNLARSIAGWLGDVANSIRGWIAGLPGAIAGALGGALAIDRSIVEGIWAGIQGARDWIMGLVGNFARGLLDGMKKAIGFGSPAKKFIPLGESIAQGMAVGIERAAGVVHAAVEALVPSPAIPAFKAAASAGGTSSGPWGGATWWKGGGSPVVINVNGRATVDQGADVIAAISAYERSNGATWRTGTPTYAAAGW